MCQVLHPLILPEMVKHPGQFADFIDAGTGTNDHNRPVEVICSCSCQWDCEAPHTGGKVEGVTARALLEDILTKVRPASAEER